MNTSGKLPASRRDFLALLWQGSLGLSGLLGMAGFARFLSYTPSQVSETRFDLGPVEQFSTSSITIIQKAQTAIIPTQDGFEALSLICPHLGCQVENNPDGFECPCHGSVFLEDGSLVRGPAFQPLHKFHLELSAEGHLILDTSVPVDFSGEN